MIYLICYDISHPRRLQRVAKILENHGIRVQYSFFQCDMPKLKVNKLKSKILKVIDLKKDSFYIYPLCEACTNNAISDGTGELLRIKSFEIL
jgi:CRISPR-associated protein Cas2